MPKRSVLSGALLVLATAAAAPLTAQEPNFGRSLAMTGAELIVGQPVNWYGPGAVYTYRLDAGAWQRESMLTASDSSRMDDFGRAVSIDGNTLVVGAPRKRDGSGVAYVFQRSGPTAPWRESAILEPPGLCGVSGAFGR